MGETHGTTSTVERNPEGVELSSAGVEFDPSGVAPPFCGYPGSARRTADPGLFTFKPSGLRYRQIVQAFKS